MFSESECCRDMDDVIGVLDELGSSGIFIPVRRAGEALERVARTVVSTVAISIDPIHGSEPAPKEYNGDDPVPEPDGEIPEATVTNEEE